LQDKGDEFIDISILIGLEMQGCTASEYT